MASHKLHIGRIPPAIRGTKDLRSVFSNFGNVLHVEFRMMEDERYNIGKVTFEKQEEAELARQALNFHPPHNLVVNYDYNSSMYKPSTKTRPQSRNQTPLMPSGYNYNNLNTSTSNNIPKVDKKMDDSDELAKCLEWSIENEYRQPSSKKVYYPKSNCNVSRDSQMFPIRHAEEVNFDGRNKFVDEETTRKNVLISPLTLTKVNVVFCTTPHDFYVKLFEEEDVNSLVATVCTTSSAPSHFITGDIVGVQCGHTWCRATVIKIDNENSCQLKLIDYHKEVESSRVKIRILPKPLAHKKYEVFHCCMSNVVPSDNHWTENDGKIFNELVSKRDFLWAEGSLVNGTYLVRLLNDRKVDVSTALAFMCDVKVVQPSRRSSINLWKNNSIVKAIVAANDFPSHLWIADNSNGYLQKLSCELNNHCTVQQPSFASDFEAGQIVAAREVAGDRFWYRAIILDVLINGWLVQYLDFGNNEVVDQVLPLPSDLENYPALAVSLNVTKLADRRHLTDFQVNADLELTVKLYGDEIKVVETMGEKKVSFVAVSIWDELGELSVLSSSKTRSRSELNKTIDGSRNISTKQLQTERSSSHNTTIHLMESIAERYPPKRLPTAEENENARIRAVLENFSDSFETPRLNKTCDEARHTPTKQRQIDSPPVRLPTVRENERARAQLDDFLETFKTPNLSKTVVETQPRNSPTKQRQTVLMPPIKAAHCFEQVSETIIEEKPIRSPIANENARLFTELGLSNSKLPNTSQPEEVEKSHQSDFALIDEIPELKGLSTEVEHKICPICYDGEMYVQIFTDENSDIFDKLAKLSAIFEKREFGLKSLPNVCEYLCGRSHEDDNWYRCKVTDIKADNAVEVRFVDYGNTEDLELDRLAELPEEFFKYPAVALPIVFDDIDPKLASHAFEILLEKHSSDFCMMRVVDNSSFPLRVTVKSFQVPLKDLVPHSEKRGPASIVSSNSSECSKDSSLNETVVDASKTERTLESIKQKQSYPDYYYKDAVNVELPIGEIVEVFFTAVHGPDSIYCWLVDSNRKDYGAVVFKLNELSSSITKFVKSEKFGPTEYVPKEGELCLAESPTRKAWCRATCLSSSKENDDQLCLLFVDYGDIKLVNCRNIRRMRPEFMKTPIETVYCSIEGISENTRYDKKDFEEFKKLFVLGSVYTIKVLELRSDNDCDPSYVIRIPSLEYQMKRFRK